MSNKLINYADGLKSIDIQPQIGLNIKGRINLNKIPKR